MLSPEGEEVPASLSALIGFEEQQRSPMQSYYGQPAMAIAPGMVPGAGMPPMGMPGAYGMINPYMQPQIPSAMQPQVQPTI